MPIKKCNICNKECAKYLFGLPNFSAIQKELDEGKIVLGGCCIYFPSPNWNCTSCSIDYYAGGYGEWSKSSFHESIDFEMDEEENPFDNKSFSQLPASISSFLQEANNALIKGLKFAFKLEIGGYTSFERIEYLFFKNTLIKYVTKAPMANAPMVAKLIRKNSLNRSAVKSFFNAFKTTGFPTA